MIRNRFLWPLFTLDFILHFGRALTFTFFPVYLAGTLGFTPLQAGYALGGSLVMATLAGIYCGVMVDRLTPLRALLLAVLASIFVYAVLPVARTFATVFMMLTAIEVAFTTMHLSVKALLTNLLSAGERAGAYSVTYTLINIAFCTAPLLGIALSQITMQTPIWGSGILSCIALAILLYHFRRYQDHLLTVQKAETEQVSIRQTFFLLIKDTRLQLFTLGGFFSALVYARFATYLSQYLGYVVNETEAVKLVTLIVTINAGTVILLQYVVGRFINYTNMVLSVIIGSGLLIAALLFYQVSPVYIFWAIATLLFSLGEVIIVPSEFLFIDSIAQDNMKGAYFGVQNISMLGGGLNSILCGVLLENRTFSPASLFYFLIFFAFTGCALYLLGIRRSQVKIFPGSSDVH